MRIQNKGDTMKEKTEEELLKEFNELYAQTFLPVKKKYEDISEIFLLWNTRKIDTRMAIERLNKAVT